MAKPRVRSHAVRLWLALPVLAAAAVLVPIPAWAIDDIYSRGVYPILQRLTTLVSNVLPIALLDILLVVAAVLVVFRIIMLIRVAMTDDVMDALWEGAKRVLRAGGLFVLVFLGVWGLNYRRVPLESAVGTPPAPSVAVLQTAIGDANALAAGLRSKLTSRTEMTYEEAAQELRVPMAAALETIKRPPLGTPGRPKYSLILTPFFRWAGVNGMLNPIGLESLVDPGLLPVERPFVLAHEWAHLAGQADEAEASAVGWLACMKGSPALAYSASIYLIMEAAGALPPAARRAALSKLEAGVKRDIEMIAKRVQAEQKPRVQRAAFKVYDEYLRANQVEDGTASYGRALGLILSAPLRDALNNYTETKR